MESEKLMPCPFCKSEHILLRQRWVNGTANLKHYKRECGDCHATFASWFASVKKADEFWNRRSAMTTSEPTTCPECGAKMDGEKEDV